MSGLQNFLGGRNDFPPPGATARQHPRADRASAGNLKFSTRDINSRHSNRSPRPSTAPVPAYASVTTNTARSIYPNPHFAHQQQKPDKVQETPFFDDSTIDSGFDDTKSDVQYEQEFDGFPTYGGHNGADRDVYDDYQPEIHDSVDKPRYDVRSHNLPSHNNVRYNKSLSPLNTHDNQETPKKAPAGISGRFQFSAQPRQIPSLELRPNQGGTSQGPDSQNHSRSNELAFEGPFESVSFPVDKKIDGSDFSEDDVLVAIDSPNRDDPMETDSARKLFESNSDVAETTFSDGGPEPRRAPLHLQQGSQNDPLYSLDYTDDELRNMKYKELADESWEVVPKAPVLILPEALQGGEVTLHERIDHFTNRDFPADSETHSAFYENLSNDQWDQAGDYLIDKFTDLIQKLKEAKYEKRKVMNKYEEELEKREEAVRGRSENLDEKLEGMRVNGEGMLRGKV